MIEAGIPPVYALQTATINAAQLLKKDKELGSITAGKLADITAVPGNLLNDIGVMSRASFVMRTGTIYKQDGKEIVWESRASFPQPFAPVPCLVSRPDRQHRNAPVDEAHR